jgi:hypothetical protein
LKDNFNVLDYNRDTTNFSVEGVHQCRYNKGTMEWSQITSESNPNLDYYARHIKFSSCEINFQSGTNNYILYPNGKPFIGLFEMPTPSEDSVTYVPTNLNYGYSGVVVPG